MPIRVLANCAMSLDGCLGLPGPKPLKLSNPEDFRRVHEMRAAADAILVGIGTVLADDPKLTVKWELIGRKPGRNPTRVVLDATGRTPPTAEVLRHGAPTVLVHAKGVRRFPKKNHDVIAVKKSKDGRLDLKAVLEQLEDRGIRTLMVEGGPQVLTDFLTRELVDELTVFVAPVLVGQAEAPRLFHGKGPLDLGLKLRSVEQVGNGAVLRFVR